MSGPTSLVLVHGSYADASSWRPVVEVLQREQPDLRILGVQLPLVTLAQDAEVVRRAVVSFGDAPVIVAAHSYGGAVISEADYSGLDVRGLVYVAAYAPAVGESVLSLNQQGAPLPSGAPDASVVDLDAHQLQLTPEAYVRWFAPDIAAQTARALAVLQRPVGFGAGGAPLTRAAWTELPTWYQVSLDDQIVDPGLQHMFVERMPRLVESLELNSSHASLLSHPERIASFVAGAMAGADNRTVPR